MLYFDHVAFTVPFSLVTIYLLIVNCTYLPSQASIHTIQLTYIKRQNVDLFFLFEIVAINFGCLQCKKQPFQGSQGVQSFQSQLNVANLTRKVPQEESIHCEYLLLPGAKVGLDVCFDLNKMGMEGANCGRNRFGFTPCTKQYVSTAPHPNDALRLSVR